MTHPAAPDQPGVSASSQAPRVDKGMDKVGPIILIGTLGVAAGALATHSATTLALSAVDAWTNVSMAGHGLVSSPGVMVAAGAGLLAMPVAKMLLGEALVESVGERAAEGMGKALATTDALLEKMGGWRALGEMALTSAAGIAAGMGASAAGMSFDGSMTSMAAAGVAALAAAGLMDDRRKARAQRMASTQAELPSEPVAKTSLKLG